MGRGRRSEGTRRHAAWVSVAVPNDGKKMEAKTKKTFPLGRIVATPNALHTLVYEDITKGLDRHMVCDWGDCCPADWKENEFSLKEGFRLFSVYHDRNGKKFWVITEADRSVTTVLMPEDY
ncbi:MAG: hypothetical protein U0790_17765 [Isosphaeraceae bacterium]